MTFPYLVTSTDSVYCSIPFTWLLLIFSRGASVSKSLERDGAGNPQKCSTLGSRLMMCDAYFLRVRAVEVD